MSRRAETAPGLSSLVSVTLKYLEWSDQLKQELPAAQASELGKPTSGSETKVRFSQTVQFRAIPSANRGRPCTKNSRKVLQGCRQKREITEQGGVACEKAVEKLAVARPKWADVFDDVCRERVSERQFRLPVMSFLLFSFIKQARQ